MMSNAMSDPWRISNEDRAKHDQQFFQLQPVNGFVTGNQAKTLFLQSGLPPAVLGKIWGLADMNADGKMDRHEFSIAMHLIRMKLKGMEIPDVLPAVLKNPPAPTMGTFGAAMGLGMRPAMPSGTQGSAPRPVMTNGSIMMGQSGFVSSSPNVGPGMMIPGAGGAVPIAQPVPGAVPPVAMETKMRSASTSSQDSTASLTEWAVPHAAKLRYTQLFNTNDRTRTGFLSGNQARGILLESKLPQPILAKIWALSDIDGDGSLTCEEFCVAMHLTDMAKAGDPMPNTLPLELVPPSYRRRRTSSVKSVSGSPGSGQLSQSIDLDDFKGINMNTFEDRRKMNFEKGQAELEKRRQALLESQRKEQEEREKKEREEQEKRERIRQEQERRRQMELEKQLAKQRELEQEKEEQRRKVMEQREAARREMERQRQLEWERQRRQDLMTQRQKEQEAVCHLKSRSKNINFDLEKLSDRMNELNSKINETRNGVTEIKSEIDNMKGQRDNKVTLINSIKLQLKEQNDKMLVLNQEKTSLEGKVKCESGANPNIDSMNIVMHSFNNKQITLNQLRDVLSNLEKVTASKLNDIHDNNNQLNSAKKELSQLIEKTDALRKSLECKRQEALDLKANTETQKPIIPEVVEDPWADNDQFNNAPSTNVTEDPFANTNAFAETASETPTNEVAAFGETDIFANHASMNQSSKSPFDEMNDAFANANVFGATNDIFGGPSPFESKNEENVFGDVGMATAFSSNASHSLFGDSPQQSHAWISDFSSSAPANGESVTSPSENQGEEVVDDAVMIKYRALYAFESRNPDELCIMPGDIIMVPEVQNAEPGWLGGELKGKTGWFPAAYVERADASDANADGSVVAGSEAVTSPASGTEETVHIVGTEMKMTLTGISEAPEGNGEVTNADGDGSVGAVDEVATDSIQHSVQSSFINVTRQSSFPDSTSPIPGQGEEVEGLQAQALFPWRAKKDNHLTFNKGDIINVKEQQDMWWYGECQDKVGWFPKSYVKLIAGPKRADSLNDHVPQIAGEEEAIEPPAESAAGTYYMALYQYQSNEPGDLSFNQGDVVLVTKEEGDWWTGCIGADRVGIFPSNYVQKVDAEGSKMKKPEIATVIAPYQATGSEQLSLQRGQLIQVRKRSPSGWWEGELQAKGKQRQIGWFPASYVKLLSSAANSPNTSARNTPDISSQKDTSNNLASTQEQVSVLFDYTAQNSDELSLEKCEIISIVNKDDPSWWKGENSQGVAGLFPSNYVQPMVEREPSPSVNNWSSDNGGLLKMEPMERKRQHHIHELIDTEQSYMEDMSIVIDVFYKPLEEAGVLTKYELQSVFVNWNELIICNVKLLKALRVRKKMTSGFVINMIGDILCETIPHLSPYIRFCSCQLNAAALIQQKTERSPEFNTVAKKCASHPRAKGMPLSSFLLKPMQRITKYPLLIKKILEYTPETHPDYNNLVEALQKAELKCSEVNESVREKENSDRLEWLQTHVQCEGVMEQLTFNSLTNSLGPRKYIHSGTLIKAKSNKELMAFLVNDFLLLSFPIKPVPPTASVFSSEKAMNSWYKMYKQPLCLNDVTIKPGPDADDLTFQIQHTDRLYTLKAISCAEKAVWIKKLEQAIQVYKQMEKDKIEKQQHQKSSKLAGVGRLLVVVCEGINLTASSSNRDGKSDPYCEVSMGTQEHKTKVVPGSLNPKWNASMQFLVKDLKQDVLCMTVYDRDLFSPNDFLGRTEIRVGDILKQAKKTKGPITKVLSLHEVDSGQVSIKFDLQLFHFK